MFFITLLRLCDLDTYSIKMINIIFEDMKKPNISNVAVTDIYRICSSEVRLSSKESLL